MGKTEKNAAKIKKAKISGLFAVGKFLLALCNSLKYPCLKTCRLTAHQPLACSPCESDPLKLTAYRIKIEVQEKPWGGNWGPPTAGAADPSIPRNPWYHLWIVNENAIRANVEPQCLTDIVADTVFEEPNSLEVEVFDTDENSDLEKGPDPNAKPAWKEITAGVGAYTVTATIITGYDDQLTGTMTPVDIVVNDIESVEWQPVDGWDSSCGNKIRLEDHLGGQRCFPEQDSPHSSPHHTIDAEVTLALAPPQGMHCKVYLKLFDPDNPLEVDKNDSIDDDQNRPDDNYGDANLSNFSKSSYIHFVSGESFKREQMHFESAYAGDDYIPGVPLGLADNGKWMIHPDNEYALLPGEPPNFDVKFQPPFPNIAMAQTAMKATCIDVKKIKPENFISWGITSRETTPFLRNLPDWTPAEFTYFEEETRDVHNEPAFWCIHGVGAYEATEGRSHDPPPGGIGGGAAWYTSVFLVFNETIRDCISTDSTMTRSVTELHQLVAFHEILHLFEFKDAGNEKPGDLPDGPIMTNLWFRSPNPLESKYTVLNPQQIRKIQAQPCPRPTVSAP